MSRQGAGWLPAAACGPALRARSGWAAAPGIARTLALTLALGLALWPADSKAAASAAAGAPASTTAAPEQTPGLLDFGADERKRILQHGPWPPPAARDAGNALAGQPAAIALGQRLFFEPRLAPDGRMACASCHLPGLAFTDGRPRGQGRSLLARNTPSLWNAVHQRWLGWDGAFDSLWSQALQPMLHPQEIASQPAHLRQLLNDNATLACLWRQAGGPVPAAGPAHAGEDAALLVPLAKALGAFVGTLVSGRTPFDDFRDALARGDTAAAARYPLPAQRGLRLFVGRGQCQLCHSGPLFSHGEFGDIGLPFFVRPGVVDPGRHGGIAALQASRFNLLGPFADRAAEAGEAAHAEVARKTRHVLAQERNFGEFKVPSLRNVALTAPYMHDGQLATLADVVQHYDQINLDRLHADGAQILQPLGLDATEHGDLLAFLHSLSDPGARDWQPGGGLWPGPGPGPGAGPGPGSASGCDPPSLPAPRR